MKPFITGIALLMIFVSIMLFESDNYDIRLKYTEVKNTADIASCSASTFYNYDLFSNEEIKIFYEEEGLIAVDNIVDLYANSRKYKLIDKYVYFFNDNHICNVYYNRKKIISFHFEYPYLFEDISLKYNKIISKASIVVTLDAGEAVYHLKCLTSPKIIRSSGYEYLN